MMNMPVKAPKSLGASLSIVPIVLLVICMVGGMAGLLQMAAARQDRAEIERDRNQLAQSLNIEAEAMLNGLLRDDSLGDLLQVQRSKDMAERSLQGISRRHAMDYAVLVEKQPGLTQIQVGDPDLLPLRQSSIGNLLQASRMRGLEGDTIGIGRESRVVQDGQEAFFIVSVPIGRNLLLIGTRSVSISTLKRIAAVMGVPDIRLALGATRESRQYAVPSIDGQSQMTLIWVERPKIGNVIEDLTTYGLIGALLIMAIGVYVFRHIRMTTEEILVREAKARHESRHDPLSGLPNRAVFCDILTENLVDLPNRDTQVAILLLDLDKFKDINDTFGHAAGDRVIVEFGERVRALLSQKDMIARLGGDEFAVLKFGVRSYLDTTRLAQAILDAAALPFMMDGAAMRVGVTIGISIAPDDGNDMATVMRAADTALYRAKNEGRNRFALYEHRMSESERMRKLVDDELRGAIERDEMTLVYQPQVHADTGKIASVEALVRWRHPTQGMISPATFISVAEERGLIVPLGDWVMRRACRDSQRWPGLRVGVNVSAIQFRQPDFVKSVEKIMKDSGVQPGLLEVELTEGVLVEDADQAEAAMVELRAIGVRLALDDFGTGYSSMIYLRRFAFDKIKIDKSFLDSMEATGESAILVHSVVHLGRALGLEVTAEGVETEEQRRFLQAVGCHYLQGYLFSKPVSAEAIDEMLRAEKTEITQRTQIEAKPFELNPVVGKPTGSGDLPSAA